MQPQYFPVGVKELKSRAELRIYKKGAREPINATFDDATDDRLIVVVKNEQVAIPKEDIDRLDAPQHPGRSACKHRENDRSRSRPKSRNRTGCTR
jgi:hypothetical protein